jgi:glycosyltransferase involved in cell wall biosynthesis
MKIAIDAFRIVSEPNTSGAVYVSELAVALASDLSVTKIYLLFPIEPVDSIKRIFQSNSKITILVDKKPLDPASSWTSQLIWIQYRVVLMLKNVTKEGELDWFIAPYHQCPVFLTKNIKILTVIHDLCGLEASSGYPKNKIGYWRHWFNFLTARFRSNVFVAISNFTKDAFILTYKGVTSENVYRVCNSVNSIPLDLNLTREILNSEKFPTFYFIAFSAGGPRKGTDLSLDAFKRYRELGGLATLILIGGSGSNKYWGGYASEHQIDHLKWVTGISDSFRDSIYANAIALVFPSRCEGFGYPVLEAMRQSCPVIALKYSPADEIVDGVASLIPDLKIDSIVNEMFHYENMDITDRIVLGKKLYAQSLKFSSDSLATGFINAMKRI